MPHAVVALDHVQLAMPPGEEATATVFYEGLLGLRRMPKPPNLEARGGCWFGDQGVEIHLGVEHDFRPAVKAHPALVIDGLDDLAEVLGSGGHPVRWDDELPGVRRCYVADPFGNRIELISSRPG